MNSSSNNQLTLYYKCNMTKKEHIVAYLISSVISTAIAYMFYHIIIISVILGFSLGFLLERTYAQSTIKKRQKKLLLQFRDFLDNMSVAAQNSNEYKSLLSAQEALKQVYNEDADIVIEVDNIILQYEKAGKKLSTLFADFAERSQLEDIKSFATIYGVIEGKSDNFGEILNQTNTIIREKIEITEEIETAITSAKSETYTMLLMPIIIVAFMSMMGSGFMDSLFTTAVGHVVATIALALFALSFFIAVKATDIEV